MNATRSALVILLLLLPVSCTGMKKSFEETGPNNLRVSECADAATSSVSGTSPDLAPLYVYDNGYWTYFGFGRDDMHQVQLPVVYMLVDRYDVPPPDVRIIGGALVAEATAQVWTIKSGEKFLCVVNRGYDRGAAEPGVPTMHEKDLAPDSKDGKR